MDRADRLMLGAVAGDHDPNVDAVPLLRCGGPEDGVREGASSARAKRPVLSLELTWHSARTHTSESTDRGSNGSKIEGEPTPEAGTEARHLGPARQVGEERREGPQEATAQGQLAQATEQEGPGRQVARAFVLTSCLALCVTYPLLVFSLLVNPLRSTLSSHRPALWPSSILPDGALAPPGRLWLRPSRRTIH